MHLTRPVFIALLVILAGCAATNPAELPSCPKTTVLEGTSTLTRFLDGPGRDLIDVNFSGEIERLNGSCLYDVDDTGAGYLNMEVRIEIRAERGPANRDRRANFEYFVTILDANGKVMNKSIFPLNIEFYGNKTLSRDTDAPVTLSIPVTPDQGGGDFRVYVGFQLTADEVRYNRDKFKPGKP